MEPRLLNGKQTISSINGVGKLDSHMEKNETRPYITPFTKTKSKQIKDLNIRPETIKLPEENIGKKQLDKGLDNDFLDLTPKAQATK